MTTNAYKHLKTIANISLFLFLVFWLINKFKIVDISDGLSEYAGLFVAVYLVAMHYYYKKYLIKQKDATIEDLKAQVSRRSK